MSTAHVTWQDWLSRAEREERVVANLSILVKHYFDLAVSQGMRGIDHHRAEERLSTLRNCWAKRKANRDRLLDKAVEVWHDAHEFDLDFGDKEAENV